MQDRVSGSGGRGKHYGLVGLVMLLMERMQGKGDLVGWAEQKHLGWTAVRVFRVVRVPWPDTRITCSNFGYRELEPELSFGFSRLGFFRFGLGFFSGVLPTHRHFDSLYLYRFIISAKKTFA